MEDSATRLNLADSVFDDLARGERPLSLNQARRHPAFMGQSSRGDRRGKSLPTLHRYIMAGVKGMGPERVKLETCNIGGVKHTTASAILRFIARENGVTSSGTLTAPHPAELEERKTAAERELDSAGI